ncbi:Ppx/GppA family phosphatase [Ureibacillus manganicus]|uniref:Exopolyphosphatase n=1 Tax=Ureibacillus manganicus DSM 26584 TaxID=1384049 RepID=A0A0A3I724_9BACL|nr:Ppx/GppA family phosphatase [Ureibacillus manganicus]KGR80524.1 exopolyphosphatase [Ureibacillus manganicus DSM 26584]
MRRLKTAIIDIGSNTIRLVLYKYEKNEGLREFGNVKTVARLRNYIESDGKMSEEGIQLLTNTLNSFKQIIDDYEVTDIKAVATAAIRQAKNKNQIISRMKKETGIKIELLSEEEEAYFGFLAVAHSMETPSAVTIDIGGGSTEITLYIDKQLQKSFSFPFGTVSLKQNFISGDLINDSERKLLRDFIKEQFKSIPWIQNVNYPIVAIGGSARNVVQIHQHRIDYPISGVHHYEIAKDELDNLNNYLGKMSLEQLRQLDGLSSDRADIIGVAMDVFLVLMDIVGTKSFQVSKKGLREGVIIHRVLQDNERAFDKYNVFEENSRRLAFEYGRSEEESKNLISLANQLYQESCDLNLLEFNINDYELIRKAAKIYSIGEYIELDSASQHTFYIITNQSIEGLNHKDRVKLALLASYKNRDYFRRFSTPFESWISKEEMKKLKDYGALLKFVYALNISKRNIVKYLQLERNENGITVKITAEKSAWTEKYQAERQKKHLERLFKQPITIQFTFERVQER